MNYRIRAAVAADIDLLARFNHAMAKESEDKPLDLDRLKAGLARLFNVPRTATTSLPKPRGTRRPVR